MTALVHAELLKLRSIAAGGWLLVATIVVVVLEALGFTLGATDGSGPGQAGDPHLLSQAVASASAGEIVLLVMGILAVTQELRFGTATSTFLVTPKRGHVVAAKMMAVALVGALFTLISVAIALPLSVWLVDVRAGSVLWERRVGEVLAGVVLVMVLYGPLGVAIGSLVRNQIAAVAGALTWLFLGEGALAGFLPKVEEWTPGGATASALQVGTWAGTDHVLPPWAGAALILAWAVLFAVLGARVTLRRDLV
jgi:ABC-2 type transport system permease protein